MIKIVVLSQTLNEPLEIVTPWDQMLIDSLTFSFWSFGGRANYQFRQAFWQFIRAVPI